MPDLDQPYRSAGYLVEPHPDVVDDPVGGQVRLLYAELAVCP
jgi:hypothetical protein